MNECAREAVKIYIQTHPQLKYNDLYYKFKQGQSSYINNEQGKSRYRDIDMSMDGQKIYVYTQFRLNGSQQNWNKFVDVCRNLGIIIESYYMR